MVHHVPATSNQSKFTIQMNWICSFLVHFQVALSWNRRTVCFFADITIYTWIMSPEIKEWYTKYQVILWPRCIMINSEGKHHIDTFWLMRIMFEFIWNFNRIFSQFNSGFARLVIVNIQVISSRIIIRFESNFLTILKISMMFLWIVSAYIISQNRWLKFQIKPVWLYTSRLQI